MFPDWLNKEFLPENRRRLREAHSYLTEELKQLRIPFLNRNAGFFIWADLSKVKPKKLHYASSLFNSVIKLIFVLLYVVSEGEDV